MGFKERRQRAAGYEAGWEGQPIDETKSAAWLDGYRAGRDHSWWKEFVNRAGCMVSGFTGRHSALITFRNTETGRAETHTISGRVVEALAKSVNLGMDETIHRKDKKQ